jgi:hypothetical protein
MLGEGTKSRIRIMFRMLERMCNRRGRFSYVDCEFVLSVQVLGVFCQV